MTIKLRSVLYPKINNLKITSLSNTFFKSTMDEPRKSSISSISSLASRPSNSSAGYCRTCSSSAIMCAELYAQFNKFRKEGELCDIVISVKTTSFSAPAHRLILASKSPFFKRYFVENKTATEFEFEESFSADGVKRILEYMYENELIVISENVEDLTRIAVFLELSLVVDRCCQFMTDNFSVSNYEHYISLAEELNLTWLLDKVFLFLEWNFVDVIESEGFSRFKTSQLLRLLCSEGLRVGREETLYTAVMKWYNYDTENRKELLESIFENVRFIGMSPKFLEVKVTAELVEELGICVDKVTLARDLQKKSQSHMCDVWSEGRHRNTSDVIYVFSSNGALVERFDQVRNTCVPCPQMNEGSSASGNDVRFAVKVNGDVFLVSSRKVLRLNGKEMRWSTVGGGVTVTDAGVCGDELAIYVVGGKQCKAVKRFLVEERKWVDLPPMNTGRRGPGVACHSNVLYVVGGYSTDESGPVAAVENFDIASKIWSSLPPMRVPRFRLSCVICDGKIFAIGGRDNVRNFLTIETFGIEAKKWDTPENHMVRARDEFCATVNEGKIFCFGGRGEKTIEYCDPSSGGVWKEIGIMGEGSFRTGLSCVTFQPIFDDLEYLS